MSKRPAIERIELTFDLLELPTTQHRAGLAGLILQIDSMGPKGNDRAQHLVPIIDEDRFTATSATITFTLDSMRGVFDDLYAAETQEIRVPNKWPGETKPKGEYFIEKADPKDKDKRVQAKEFAYDVVQPTSPCLHRHLGDDGKVWLDLWRQMIWTIPRGGNNVRARAPFNDLANGKDHCGEGIAFWGQLLKLAEKGLPPSSKAEPISGALMLGAQAVNAEGVSFAGRVDHNLLLHFWQLVVMTFVPQVVNRNEGKLERIGYAITVPDVADLVDFRHEFPELLQRLASEPSDRTHFATRVDLPEQASLEMLRSLELGEKDAARREKAKRAIKEARPDLAGRQGERASLVADKASRRWGSCVAAVESYHMVKVGNNIKMLALGRLSNRRGLIKRYEKLRDRFLNPLFRAAQMRALIDRSPWHEPMIPLFVEYPWPFFIKSAETPRTFPWFGRDARLLLHDFAKGPYIMNPDDLDHEKQAKHLGVILHRLVEKYVERKAERKTGIVVAKLPKRIVRDKDGEPVKRKDGSDLIQPVFPKEFREAQQRVCSDTFLAMRSRHDQDFVAYFAESICSVDHRLSQPNYQFLIRVLMTRPDPNPVGERRLTWEDVKAIAMIAVSACSFQVRTPDAEPEGNAA